MNCCSLCDQFTRQLKQANVNWIINNNFLCCKDITTCQRIGYNSLRHFSCDTQDFLYSMACQTQSYLIFVTTITTAGCGEKICHVEKFFHMTDCHVEKFHHMTNFQLEKCLHMTNFAPHFSTFFSLFTMWRHFSN